MNKPKQFLDILGTGKTLIQQTFERFENICPTENIYIVTSTEYKELVQKQLPQLNEKQILLEPYRKNTAPCIAYAAYTIKKINPEAILIVAPSDHIILKNDEFTKDIKIGLDFISKDNNMLTLGIKPSRPETGYGYIQFNKSQLENNPEGLVKVKTFTEKPNYELAKIFFETGEFYWNSGIFIWSVNTILKAFEEFLPDINALFKEAYDKIGTNEEEEAIKNVYLNCKNISVDFGIMEKAQNVYVLCSDFGWSDLGTWGSLYEHSVKDNNSNAIHGNNVFTYNTNNCIITVPKDKLVVVEGLDNYIIAESDNILLICNKKDEQEIRQIVNDIKIAKGEDYI
jgi:mannose-1-phosphate guanylyltransferase